MSKIYSLSIKNFRGIKEFNQVFGNEKFVVLIGRGNSGKSTILQAINYVLSPTWNIGLSDLDFFNTDVTQPIEIEATITDFPRELLTDSKYGLYVRKIKEGQVIDDFLEDDNDNLVDALSIRFRVDSSLEPKWCVLCGRDDSEPKEISASDRAKFNVFMVADYADNQFSFGRYSPLSSLMKLSDTAGNTVSQKLLDIIRNIHELTSEKGSFNELDGLLESLKANSSQLGLSLELLKTAIEFKDNSISGNSIALHNGNIPYRRSGKGSKRLLSIAIQKQLTQTGGIVLIDELEQGLEPDRIINITRYLKSGLSGQIFVTTHSSYTLVEASYNNLFLMRERASNLISFTENLQGILRTKPWAFFAKKIICCEGKTEQGFVRGIDTYLRNCGLGALSSFGVIPIDCKGGDNFIKDAKTFKKLGYDVFVVMDNDVADIRNLLTRLDECDIPYVKYEDGCYLEKQIIKDVSWECIKKLIDCNLIRFTADVKRKLDTSTFDLSNQNDFRENFIKLAKEKSLYKDIPGGEFLAEQVLPELATLDDNVVLKKNVNTLLGWIKN